MSTIYSILIINDLNKKFAQICPTLSDKIDKCVPILVNRWFQL